MKLLITVSPSLGLNQAYQRQLEKKWDSIVSDPFGFTPSELQGKVSLEDVFKENTKLGEFASNHLKQVFCQSTIEDKIERMNKVKKVVAVGFGRSYDSQWLYEASIAGYETWWLDVSSIACHMATSSMELQYGELLKNLDKPYSKPIVKHCEVRSILADPNGIGLDLSTVEVWYFCRTLTCLSENSAKIVLQQLGNTSLSIEEDPEGKNRIELVAAMRDYNLTRVGSRSKLYTIKQILSDLAFGAGRPVRATFEASHKYFDQIYTAITIRS